MPERIAPVYKNWFSQSADVRERYDYLYSLAVVVRVKAIAEPERTHWLLSTRPQISYGVATLIDFSTRPYSGHIHQSRFRLQDIRNFTAHKSRNAGFLSAVPTTVQQSRLRMVSSVG
jgi:hypothetical protein